MTLPSNEDQIAYWNGKAGEKWAHEQAVLDTAMTAFADRLLEEANVTQGARVLDIGCGCGTVTLLASSAAGPTGFVVGVDISSPMIERARKQSSGRGNVQFVLADASTESFDGSFDVAISRFGVMFFADPTLAFRNLKTALKKGGRLVFVCWRALAENEWARIPREVTLPLVAPPEPPKPDAPGPFAFADRARVERILSDAGFSDIDIAPFDADLVISETGIEGAVDFSTRLGPAGALLRETPEDVVRTARDAVRKVLGPLVTAEGRVAMHGATWMVRARA
ncbi:MAG: class I SAM-dependent methyltransferase [Polyangiaceae bacterium]